MSLQQLRIARPVSDLDDSTSMYTNGLGLKKIGEFRDHAGFNGCMIGRQDLSWHLEFTQCVDHPVEPSPSKEDLLVLYFPEQVAWEKTCGDMESAGFSKVSSFNPYWDAKGMTFQDKDGYRVVIQNMKWD